MSGRVADKVAFITGAARGQGRSHAVRLAQEGADIIAVDLYQQIDSVPYALSTPIDMTRTVEEVEALGRRIVAAEADVRDFGAVQAALDKGVEQLGRLDIVCANAGILSLGALADLDEQSWQDVIDVNLTGVWHSAKASISHLRTSGGGSIILTSSMGGLMAMQNSGHYGAAKHGLVGLMRVLALELAGDRIRVNTLHPSSVNTEMIHNSAVYERFAPDLAEVDRTIETLADRFESLNALPVPWIEPVDVSNAVLWLASDEARYVTGVTLPIDAGMFLK